MCPQVNKFFVLAALLLFLAGCSDSSPDSQPAGAVPPPQKNPPDAAAVAANNQGVGLMGQFKYAEAEQVFAELVGQYPDWAALRVNLAIATLNRQQEGDETAALAMAERVLEDDPDNLRANYVAGLLHLYLTAPARAQVHFRRVVDGDPTDPYAAYYLAQCLAQGSEYEQALSWYRRALSLDPYLRSAYYGAFQALQRLERPQEARELIGNYQRLAANPRARLAEFKYTRMGPKATATAINLVDAVPATPPKGPVFLPPRELLPGSRSADGEPVQAVRPVSITVADVRDDGWPDLFVAGAAGPAQTPNLLLLGQADGGFVAQPQHPLARVARVNAALWGDYDNDGLLDVYLCRNGPNSLWRQFPQGHWEDVTLSTLSSGGDLDTVDGALFDADHDGDLDLFLVNSNGPNELLNNNLDGTFRPLAQSQGIGGEGGPSQQVIPVDIDRDRDVDIIVLNESPPHEVYLNDRLWAYRPAPGFDEFRQAAAVTGLTADRDADGIPEIYTLSAERKVLQWARGLKGHFEARPVDAEISPNASWFRLAVLDTNGDGSLELIGAGSDGWGIAAPAAARFQATLPEGRILRGLTPVLLDRARGPAMIGLQDDGALALWQPGPGRHPYLSVTLSGKEDKAQSMRSNASGIGAELALRVGSRWTLRYSPAAFSGPGQSLQPLAFGLGGAPSADFLAIDWSDGVYQTELDLPAGELISVQETQRQLSSCPVLFAWDGAGYRFVSDLLGVGGMGYALGPPGVYAQPRPRENLLLPAQLLQPRNGRYLLKLAEPMEEAAYLDSARLVAYDLPPDWQLVLDERMGTGGPEPTGEPRFYRRELLPLQARNERGQTVTETIREADGRAAPPGPLDARFVGRLKGQHSLTLVFSEPLDAGSGAPLLVVDGWVEYPYSQTSFAAWQAGAAFQAPTLEALDGKGVWRTLLRKFGYPAGMPRRMSVPLPHLPPGTRRLRLRTNQQIYWDRIAVAFAETPPSVRRQPLPLLSARVAKSGFARRTTHAQHRPDYDYAARSPFWDARYLAGFYTNLGGGIEALVSETDDALAIIGSGEEIHLEFAAAVPSPPEGWTRRFVLETNGWTKDMDLFTRDGETLEPLPGTGGLTDSIARLHARFNQRYQDGH